MEGCSIGRAFHDNYDLVLGYPLKTLDQKYDNIVSRDIPVNAG